MASHVKLLRFLVFVSEDQGVLISAPNQRNETILAVAQPLLNF